MIKTYEYLETVLDLKKMHIGTNFESVLYEPVYGFQLTPFLIGVNNFLSVNEVVCRLTGEIAINEKSWKKLKNDIEFKVYIAKVMYAIHSAEEIFEEPEDWKYYFEGTEYE